MGRDHELRIVQSQVMYAGQHGELTLRRQRSLRLIEDVKASPAKAFHQQGQKRLTMGLLVKRSAAIGIDDRWSPRSIIEMFDLGGHVKETLGTEEIAVARPLHAFGDP
jgi:hypothetical protein